MQVKNILNQKCSNWDHNHCLESFHHSTLSPKISLCMYLVEEVFSVWETAIWLGTWFWGGFFGDVLFFDCNLFNCQFRSIWRILPLHSIILKPEISYFWLTNVKGQAEEEEKNPQLKKVDGGGGSPHNSEISNHIMNPKLQSFHICRLFWTRQEVGTVNQILTSEVKHSHLTNTC